MDAIRKGRTSDKTFWLILVEGDGAVLNRELNKNDCTGLVTRLRIIGSDNYLWITHGKRDGSVVDIEVITEGAVEGDLIVACFPKRCAAQHPDLDFLLNHHDARLSSQLLGGRVGSAPITVVIVSEWDCRFRETEWMKQDAYQFLDAQPNVEVPRPHHVW